MIEEETFFSRNLRRALEICIAWWPPLQMVIRNERPNRSSQADTINYADMSPEEVQKALVAELHLFIMEHDVKSEDIEKWLLDKLENLYNAETQQDSAGFIGTQLQQLMADLQKGSTSKMAQLEQMYEKVKNMKPAYQKQGEESQDEQVQEEQMDQEQDDGDEDEQTPAVQPSAAEAEQAKKAQEREKQLQDDGWIVVRKK